MPTIKVKSVVSCSNEDLTHKAENLLVADTYRKWRCAQTGEKQISVILQFEKSESIHSIDIGNEGSAFVEVLVGNSTSACEQDFEVFLVSSFFMSPTESRSGTNLNRVRMFGADKLAKPALAKRWDRVKIICTQPYNKNLHYGLSFIRFNSAPDPDETPATSGPKVRMLGQFVVKDEDQDCNDALKPGALFFNRAPKPQAAPAGVTPPPVLGERGVGSYAVATLEAGTPSLGVEKTPEHSTKEAVRTKRRFELSTAEGSGKKSTPSPSAPKRQKVASPVVVRGREGGGREREGGERREGRERGGREGREGREREGGGREGGGKEGERSTLLSGCVLVFSGFQNPLRSTLRDSAISMGAVYRGTWGEGCTHLVCAFANTPKYSQVKQSGGSVVRKDWILDCERTGKLLPFKRYLLDGPATSSEDEEGEGERGDDSPARPPDPRPPSPRPPSVAKKTAAPRVSGRGDELEQTRCPSPPNPREGRFGSTDEEMRGPHTPTGDDSGCDTEDEIRRVQDQIGREGGDPYMASTDENTDTEEGGIGFPIPQLPDLFEGKNFLLYGDFPNNEHRLLTRYITAFNGALEEYMSETVNFVVTAEEWDDRFDEALMENVSLAFVRPRWIYTCNERQRLVPHQPFVVVPSA